MANKIIYVISPIDHSISASNTSVAGRALIFAKIASKLVASKVVVISQSDISRMAFSEYDCKVLIDFRPTDITQHYDKIGNFTGCLMLIHNQDKVQHDAELYYRISSIMNNCKASLATTTKSGMDFLRSTGVGVNIGVLRLPISIYPETINSKAVCDILSKTALPEITLWLSPGIRKNSYFGMVCVLDAIKSYGGEVNLNVISRYSSCRPKELATYFGCNSANIELYTNPGDRNLHHILSKSHTVVLSSYDEGLDLPLYESARLGCDVIASGIDVHEEGARIYSNINLFECQDEITVFGHKYDEINTPIQIPYPSYKDMHNKIVDSLNNWKISKERMLNIFRRGIHTVQPWRINQSHISKFTNTGFRITHGRCKIEVI